MAIPSGGHFRHLLKKHSTCPHTAHLNAARPHLHLLAKVYCNSEHLQGLPQLEAIVTGGGSL